MVRRRADNLAAVFVAALVLVSCTPGAVRGPRSTTSSVSSRTALDVLPVAARARILYGNGDGFFFKGRYLEALQEYSKVIAIAPGHAEAWRARGAANAAAGMDAEADMDYGRAVELAPKDAEIWLGRGLYRFSRGRYADAIDDFEQTVAIDPVNATAHLFRSLACERVGRLREAAEARALYVHCTVPRHGSAPPVERPPARELEALRLTVR